MRGIRYGILAGLLLLASCSEQSHPHTVDLVGNSITVVSQDAMKSTLSGAGYEVSMDAAVGIRADQAQVTHPSDATIIELGTNDVVQKTDPQITIDNIARLAHGDCVAIVTVSEHVPSFTDPDIHDRAVHVNSAIYEFARKHHYHVIDWNKILEDYTAVGEPEGPILADLVHPTPLGAQKLADAYLDTLKEC